MTQSGCVELLGRLNQLYEPLIPCAGLNREIMAAHDLLRQWRQPLEAKLEQQDATKPLLDAASLKELFAAQLLRIEAEAHKLPSAMSHLICAVVKLLAALPLEREKLLSVDALRTLTLGFLELTYSLSCDPLLQIQAPAQAKSLSVTARSLEYMQARAKIWPLLHEPSQILDFALNLSTDCQREIQLLVHPYYEPQGQCLPAWSKQVFKALSKSELLLQRLTMLNQHASKDELAVVSAANSLLDLCRNAYQQASQQPDIAPHLLTQLAALYEQATQVLAPLQQDPMPLSQVVALCAQLYALGQELQRKLARHDEPCALKWASTSEQREALLLGLQPQVEHSRTKLERVTKGALSSKLYSCLNKCYQQCVQAENKLNVSTEQSQPSTDNTALISVLEQLKQQYDELLDIIDPARTQDAGMTVLSLSWLNLPLPHQSLPKGLSRVISQLYRSLMPSTRCSL